MKKRRITTVLHPGTLDSSQGLIWAEAHYPEGECFPWLLLTPTQLVLLARAGRITLLALMETSSEELSAITGCTSETAEELARRIADDAAYWQSQEFLDECRDIQAGSGLPTPQPADYDMWRRERPEYRTPAPVELVRTPRTPSFPWPEGDAWNSHMSSLLVGQFEGTGSELRHLLSPQAAQLPGTERYLKDPYVVAKYAARRGEVTHDLSAIEKDAKSYELAQWLSGELRYELQALEEYLDRWLAQHP